MTLLGPGDDFPAITMRTSAGELTLPDALAGGFGVVLFNRGAWCPYCTAQLRSFQRSLGKFAAVGAKVVALWVDDEATTEAFIEKNAIEFPLGYGAVAESLAEATGAFVNPDPPFVQSTGFVLGPDGKVVLSVYSSGAIGRLTPDDVLGLIRYLTSQPAH